MPELHNHIHVEGWVAQDYEKVLGSFCPGCVIQTVMEGKGSDVGLKPSEWPLSTALSLPTMLTRAWRAPASPVHALSQLCLIHQPLRVSVEISITYIQQKSLIT